MILNAVIYIILLYTYGIQKGFSNNLNLYKFLILSPLLISAFYIDYKLHIIPNRLNLTIFEVGLVTAVLGGISDINFAINAIEGMLLGGAVFLLITLIGGFIAGKEAMGYGDVKFMASLGLYFGFYAMLFIILMSFLVGAILSIILILLRIKKTNEYIFQRILQFSLLIISAYFVGLCFYVYSKIGNVDLNGSWISFIWPLPAIGILGIIYARRYKLYFLIPYSMSFTLWTLLLSIFLQFLILGKNIWLIFLIGAPLQLAIIITFWLKK